MFVLQRSEESKACPLKEAKAALLDQVDEATGKVRQSFVTPIIGQELTYREKERQAAAYVALPVEPDPEAVETKEEFGFVLGEVGLTAETPWQVAQVILGKAAIMRQIGPIIVRARMVARAAIQDAETEEAAHAAFTGFEAVLAGISKNV
jgi:hypothetical protein